MTADRYPHGPAHKHESLGRLHQEHMFVPNIIGFCNNSDDHRHHNHHQQQKNKKKEKEKENKKKEKQEPKEKNGSHQKEHANSFTLQP